MIEAVILVIYNKTEYKKLPHDIERFM